MVDKTMRLVRHSREMKKGTVNLVQAAQIHGHLHTLRNIIGSSMVYIKGCFALQWRSPLVMNFRGIMKFD